MLIHLQSHFCPSPEISLISKLVLRIACWLTQNGMHYGSANTYPYNIGDSTRSAEAWRLIATTVRGRGLFSVNAILPVPLTQVQHVLSIYEHPLVQ